MSIRTIALRVFTCCCLVLGACGGDNPKADGSPTPAASAASASPAPTAVNLDALALEFLLDTQEYLDSITKPGTFELAPVGVNEVAPYGKVLQIKVIDTKTKAGKAGVYTLLTMARIAGSMRDDLTGAGIQYVSFEDPTGGLGYAELSDLLAFADGEIEGAELSERLILDF